MTWEDEALERARKKENRFNTLSAISMSRFSTAEEKARAELEMHPPKSLDERKTQEEFSKKYNEDYEKRLRKSGYKTKILKEVHTKDGVSYNQKVVVPKYCFVATTVYGDINAPQVQTLREFRDNVLMPSRLGKIIIDFYYGGAGEKAARFLESKVPQTIPSIRKGLNYIVRKYESKDKVRP